MRVINHATRRFVVLALMGLAATPVAWGAVGSGVAAGGGGGGEAHGGGGGGGGVAAPSGGGGGGGGNGGGSGRSGGITASPVNVAPAAPSGGNGIPAPTTPIDHGPLTIPNPGPSAPPSGTAGNGGDHNGNGRAPWRHRGDNGGNAYGTPVLPYGYGNDYITAGNDGYYNNYYGYAPGYPYGDWNNGVNTGGNNAGGTTDVPANDAAAAPPAAPAQAPLPSAVATAAQIENSVENSPELIAADGVVRRDQIAYDAERRRVIGGLANDPKYQAAVNRRRAAQSQVAAIKSNDVVPDPAMVGPVAQEKLDAADEVTRLREAAVDNDPAAKAAKTKLDLDVQRRDEIRQQLLAKYQPAATH